MFYNMKCGLNIPLRMMKYSSVIKCTYQLLINCLLSDFCVQTFIKYKVCLFSESTVNVYLIYILHMTLIFDSFSQMLYSKCIQRHLINVVITYC